MTDDRCQVARCKNGYDLIYLRKRICNHHWDRLSGDPARLREALGIKDKRRTTSETEDLFQPGD